MKISVRWLRELCPVTLSDDEIARKLTFAGLEIEGRAVQLESVLDEAGGRREGHVRRHGPDDQQVHVGGVAAGGLQAADRGRRLRGLTRENAVASPSATRAKTRRT